MKKITLVMMMVVTIISYSQKKKNGTVYIEHPAIDAVEAFVDAFEAGNTDLVASFLSDSLKIWDGNDSNKDAKPGTKERMIKNVSWWKENIDYLSVERSKGAYPDAIEYKDSEQEDVVWVQTWNHLKGVHNKTGVKIDMPAHRLYVVDKDNKIKTIINYSSGSVWREMRESFVERENGTIYNHHENINTVRKTMAAFEFKDMEKFFDYFDEKATFRNIHMPVGSKGLNVEEEKEALKSLFEKYDIHAFDQQGYPDYLNYGLGDAKVVQSWWKARMTRKSDKKKLVIPVMFIHNFNDEGKITSSIAYYSLTLMNK